MAVGPLVGFIQHAANDHHLLRQVDPVDHWSLGYMTYLLKQAHLCVEPAESAE